MKKHELYAGDEVTDKKDQKALDELLIEATGNVDFPFSRSPIGAWGTGLILFVVITALVWAFAVFVEGTSFRDVVLVEVADTSMVAVTIYTLTMNEVGRRGFMRDYVSLSPSLTQTPSETYDIMHVLVEGRGWAKLVSGFIFSMIAFPFVTFIVFIDSGNADQAFNFSSVLLWVMLFVVGQAMFDTFNSYRRLLKLMKPGLKIDLLDLRPLEVIGRTGVRVAMMMAIGAALATPLLAEENALFVTSIFLVLLLGFAFLILILPAAEAMRAIRSAKGRELRRVNNMIRQVRHDMKGDLLEASKMQGLIAYRTMIMDISDWPIGVPTLVRVLALTLLPVASVLASVMLEQVVEKFI